MTDERAGAWILGETVAAGELSVLRLGRAGDAVVVIKRLHGHAARDPAVRALFDTEAAAPRPARSAEHGPARRAAATADHGDEDEHGEEPASARHAPRYATRRRRPVTPS